MSQSQDSVPPLTRTSQASGMTKPWVIASMKGGHCLTVRTGAGCSVGRRGAGHVAQPVGERQARAAVRQATDERRVAAEDDPHGSRSGAATWATAACQPVHLRARSGSGRLGVKVAFERPALLELLRLGV